MTFVFKKFIPAFIFLLIVTVLLCLPPSKLPNTGGNWFSYYQIDKLVHITLFAILVFLFCRPIQLKGLFTNIITKVYFVLVIVFTMYGFIMELVQHYLVYGRSFEGLDILADAVGSYIGYAIAKKQLQKIKPPTTESVKAEIKEYATKLMEKRKG